MFEWLIAFLRSVYLRVVMGRIKKLQYHNMKLSSTDLEDEDEEEEKVGREGGKKKKKNRGEGEERIARPCGNFMARHKLAAIV